MKTSRFFTVTAIYFVCLALSFSAFSQNKSQEFSEDDGIPVLTKHLPDYENVANRATYILNTEQLRNAFGQKPVLETIDFTGGTEAVTAKYPEGTLLIVEYTTPQFSVEADSIIQQKLAEAQDKSIVYRRIGNYSVFVFDSANEVAANLLLDQIKYEKDIRWLGRDPFALKRAERNFVLQASDLFTNIVIAIVGSLGISVILGIFVGILFYFLRQQKRAKMTAFSDAGGMTRLNLDGFTPEILPDHFLEK